MVSKGDFLGLAQKAIDDPTQENLENLWYWFVNFGETYWNGECFDASLPFEPSGTRSLSCFWRFDESQDCYFFEGYELR